MHEYSRALAKQVEILDFMESERGQALWNAQLSRVTASESNKEMMFGAPRRALLLGDPFYWSSEMCSFLEIAAENMPNWTLTFDQMPTDNGFLWFERPLNLEPWRDDWIAPLTALSWIRIRNIVVDPAPKESHFVLMDNTEPESLYPSTFYVTFYVADERLNPSGIPVTHIPWHCGEDLEFIAARAANADPPDKLNRLTMKLRYFAASWALISQTVLATDRKVADRPTRRRAARMIDDVPLVRVIRLRRTAHPKHGSQPVENREYSCQWVVSGHWRQQWYRSRQVHQPKWIAPYVKGDPSKPLKPPRARVFAVVR
jgi:hypothetical protein